MRSSILLCDNPSDAEARYERVETKEPILSALTDFAPDIIISDYMMPSFDGMKTLLSHFSEGLAVLEDTGEYRNIYDEWLGVYAHLHAAVLR